MQNLSVNLQQTYAAYVTQALYVILLFRHLSVEKKTYCWSYLNEKVVLITATL